MQDAVLKILIELYLDGGWCSVFYPPQALHDYVDSKPEKDGSTLYSINPLGVRVIEKWMRSMGREVGPSSGIAIQKRKWDEFQSHNFTVRQMTLAFKKICDIAQVPIDILKDQYGRRVVVVKDIDMALSRVGHEIEWETHDRNANYLRYKLRWSEAAIWLWCWLDRIRSDLREIPLQQEFVLWESS
jgi:hypothetical protein